MASHGNLIGITGSKSIQLCQVQGATEAERVSTWFKHFSKLVVSAPGEGDTYCFSRAQYTVKPVLSGHSTIDKTKILKTNGSLMKVKIIAECSKGSILQYF